MRKTLSVLLALVCALSLVLAGTGLAVGVNDYDVNFHFNPVMIEMPFQLGQQVPLQLSIRNNTGVPCAVTASFRASYGTLSAAGWQMERLEGNGRYVHFNEITRLTATPAPTPEPTPEPTPAPTPAGRSNPNTGDGVSPLVWLGLAALSGGALLALARKGKKLRGKGLLSLLLCAALLTAIAAPAARVHAAGPVSYTQTLDYTVGSESGTITSTFTLTPLTLHTCTVRQYGPTGALLGTVSAGSFYKGDAASFSLPAVADCTASAVGNVSGGAQITLGNTGTAGGTVSFTAPDADVALDVRYVYTPRSYTITRSGSLTALTGTATPGTTVNVDLPVTNFWHFVSASVTAPTSLTLASQTAGSDSASGSLSFTMPVADVTIAATYAENTTYWLMVDYPFEASPNYLQERRHAGESIVITPPIIAGQYFVSADVRTLAPYISYQTGKQYSDTVPGELTFVMPAADVTFTTTYSTTRPGS